MLATDVCKQLGFIPIFMPTYSPQYNSIETLWAHLKKRVGTQISEKLDEQGNHDLTEEDYRNILTKSLEFDRELLMQILLANREPMEKLVSQLLDMLSGLPEVSTKRSEVKRLLTALQMSGQ